MKKAVAGILVAAAVVAAFVGGIGYGRRGGSGPAAAPAKKEKKAAYWVDPMHPSYRSDKPGIAPDCGMDLVPVYEDGTQGAGGAGALPPGMVQVSAEKQQWIGVESTEAEVTSIEQVIRAVGRVAVDETRIVRVTSRAEGWVEKVMVNFTGRAVTQGEPMLTIYSPELVASQQEYLLALKAKDVLEHSSVPGVTHSNETLVAASRRRLEHWGLDEAAIQKLEKTGEPQRTLTVFAPASGFVTARNAYPNLKVTGETELYTLSDQSRVWILADVFESDAAAIRMGQSAKVSVQYLPNRVLRATVTNILPQVDPQTRTLKVRLEADNPGDFLKPDLFVTVEFTSMAAPKLTVPTDAVLDSGQRQVVFVDRGAGLFEKRLVTTGERFDERVEIVSGLKDGERVVISRAFLLDSESQLKSPAPATPAAEAPAAKPAPGGPAEHRHD